MPVPVSLSVKAYQRPR